MNATTRKVVNVGYGLALALLAANALLAYLDIHAIVRGNWWVQHTREVVAQLERAASTLKDAETGQRGYLLTGKDEYLKPYVDAANGLDKDLDRLFTLTADNPDQQARLAELRRIAGEKIDELGRIVALMRKGDRDAALAVVQTDRGKALMDRARALVVEMRGEEDRLLTQRSAAASNAVWRAVASVVVATIIVSLSLLLVAYLKRREDAERDRAVEALRLSEEWLSRMMESIGDGVVATDGRGRVRLMNPVAQALTGWPQAEAVGRPVEEVFVIVNEETRRPAESPVLRAAREGVVMGLANHTVLIARGGAETSIEDSAAPIKDESGNVVGVVMVFQDATERRRHEAALRESEERHRTILESITDAFFALDRGWRFTYVNRQAEALLGRGRDDLLGKSLWQEYPETVGNDIERRYRRAMDEGEAVEFEEFYPPHDRWYENHLYPSEDGLSVYFRDITQRRRHEERLREDDERMRLATEATGLGIWDFDPRTGAVVTNGYGKAVFGLPPGEELTYETFMAAVPAGDRERVHRANQEALAGAGGGRYAIEYQAVGRVDGIVRWVEAGGQAYFDREGRATRFLGTLLDVTGRKRAEEQIRRDRERLLAAMDASDTGTFRWNPRTGAFLEFDDSLKRLFGLAPDEPVRSTEDFISRVHPDDVAKLASAVDACRRGADFEMEYRVVHPDGEVRWLYDRAKMQRDAEGVPTHLVGACTDITERREAEGRLRQSEEQLRGVFQQSMAGIALTDTTGRFTLANERYCEIVRRPADELYALRMQDITPPDDLSRNLPLFEKAMKDGTTFSIEKRYVLPDGSHVWVNNNVSTLRGDDGQTIGVLCVSLDITDRKRAESLLVDQSRILEQMAQGEPLGDVLEALSEAVERQAADGVVATVLMMGDDGTHLRPAAGLRCPVGYSEAIGLVPVGPTGGSCGTAAYRGERVIVADIAADPLWADFRGPALAHGLRACWSTPIPSSEGKVIGTFAVYSPSPGHPSAHDLRVADVLARTAGIAIERQRSDDLLRAAKDDAERANKAKDQFLAVLSHELRTPLNPILLAASSMLETTPEPEEVRPTLEMIRQNVKLQARLIDDLLDVMRIVQGKMPLHWGVSDCHALIEQSVQICQSDVLGKSQELVLDLAAQDHHVNADSARLHQVLWNLVRNAVKFTPEGGRVAVRTRNEDNGEGHVVIEVSDTGIGIEPHVLPTIFDPFQQGETTITRRYGGLGLGLAICKGVVDAHGGSMTVESEGPGLGTTFRVMLKTMPEPVVEADGDGGESQPPPSLNRLNILLVEDEAATLRLMARLLKGLGHRVTAAGTVADAWAAFQAGDFDLIVSDIGLPDGTGLDLMRRVKALRRVPAIALTGYGTDEDVRRGREAGFTTHMTKPIDFTKLEAMIRLVAN